MSLSRRAEGTLTSMLRDSNKNTKNFSGHPKQKMVSTVEQVKVDLIPDSEGVSGVN